MKINSVWHITLSGRSLRIDSHSSGYSIKDIAVFTRKSVFAERVKEKTRIIAQTVYGKMNLRKFLVLTEGTAILAGPFEIKLENVSSDGEKTNISINGQLLFLGFIPETHLIIPFEKTVLLPADSRYYSADDIDRAVKYISALKPEKVMLSGDMAEKWADSFSRKIRTVIVNEAFQDTIFK